MVPFFLFATATISRFSSGLSIGSKILMVLYIPNIIELIGLGLAPSIILVIVHRFRREIMNLDDIRINDAIVKHYGDCWSYP